MHAGLFRSLIYVPLDWGPHVCMYDTALHLASMYTITNILRVQARVRFVLCEVCRTARKGAQKRERT